MVIRVKAGRADGVLDGAGSDTRTWWSAARFRRYWQAREQRPRLAAIMAAVLSGAVVVIAVGATGRARHPAH